MFDFLFGEGQYGLRFLFAFIVVLALIALTTWLVRRFGGDRLGAAAGRGRQPRLAVIDAAAVDGRRRLILIRRDNVEHLLMIGGPTDVVVEANIVRAAAAPRELAPGRVAAAPEPRAAAAAEASLWPLQPHTEPSPSPPPAPPPRQPRAPVPEEPVAWSSDSEPPAPPVPRPSRQSDPLVGLAAELSRQPPLPEPAAARPVRERAPPRDFVRERELAREREAAVREQEAAREREAALEHEAAREREAAIEREAAARERESAAREREAAAREAAAREAPPREREVARATAPQAAPSNQPAFASAADQNLAEMAQRLEAALRRAPKPAEPRPVEPAPAAMPAPAPAPAPASAPELTVVESRVARIEPRPLRAEPLRAVEPKEQKPPPPRSLYDSLEQEMASLLSRPQGKN